MCQQITILAQDQGGHVVAQCEHGTIHFFWVRMTMLLTPDELQALLALLEDWQRCQTDRANQRFSVSQIPDGRFQLWCEFAGLTLNHQELNLMRDLLWLANQRLSLAVNPPDSRMNYFTNEYRVISVVPARAGVWN